jgi:hypothetical protein
MMSKQVSPVGTAVSDQLGGALDARAVLGFEFGSVERPERELVVL